MSIEVKNISKYYEEQLALDEINFKVNSGEIVGFLGPNGAGKSTTMKIISCFIKPSKGEVLVDGTNIEKNLISWQKQIGYVPQEVYLLDDTIKSNVAFGVKEKDFDAKLFQNSLKLAQVDDFVNSLPEKEMTKVGDRGVRISGGQKQRLGIARAMYFSPNVLILDEPTSALDKENETKIINDLYKLSAKNSIIIVTHKLSVLENCNKIFEIDNGKIIEKEFKEF